MTDILIAGAGTAGLSAAIYGARAGKSVLVLESAVPGGQIITTPEIENYPGIRNISGAQFASDLLEQATGLGARVAFSTVTGIRREARHITVLSGDKEYLCRALIIAAGAKNRPLGLKREEALTGKGVSYCATCDGAFFKGKNVAVVGGGNTALEDAAFLSAYCETVTLIHRRDSFRGEQHLAEALRKKSNVAFLLDSTVEALHGEERLSSITVKNKKTGEESKLAVSGLFVAVGQIPENGVFSPPVRLDEKGYIAAGEDCKTNVDGIFAAGDCRTKTVRQLATAAADGAVAAIAAAAYLDI